MFLSMADRRVHSTDLLSQIRSRISNEVQWTNACSLCCALCSTCNDLFNPTMSRHFLKMKNRPYDEFPQLKLIQLGTRFDIPVEVQNIWAILVVHVSREVWEFLWILATTNVVHTICRKKEVKLDTIITVFCMRTWNGNLLLDEILVIVFIFKNNRVITPGEEFTLPRLLQVMNSFRYTVRLQILEIEGWLMGI